MDLRAYLRAARARPFRYGRWDCALFTAGWVELRTGRDLTLGIRYDSLRDGRAKLAAAGFADHVAVAAAQLPRIAVAMAQEGDVAALGASLGIVAGERLAFLSRRGVEYLPLLSADRAFKVRPH
ncbi:MAG: hypothetical protein HLUCCA12_12210 [Rhodobacteraceae bacterium HLUCCA12]|nr:MAG: hypothetical protein HLUCCA12_12210 [Rhodobacteraceae bacterium HLUCCA12]